MLIGSQLSSSSPQVREVFQHLLAVWIFWLADLTEPASNHKRDYGLEVKFSFSALLA